MGLLSGTITTAVAQTAPPIAAPTAPRGRAAAPPFTGRITDAATGEGLIGANIIFVDLKQGAATGVDGSFSFASLPRGRFTVQIRSLGYNTVTETVDTGSGQPLDVKLTVAATEIGQVVVTGVIAGHAAAALAHSDCGYRPHAAEPDFGFQHCGCHCPTRPA